MYVYVYFAQLRRDKSNDNSWIIIIIELKNVMIVIILVEEFLFEYC